jgi:branched-chain amino acid transport system substrate-binding protein
MRYVILAGLIGALAMFATGCGSSGDSTSSTSASTTTSAKSASVRIGMEGPLSGDQKVTGVGMLRGAQLAAEELNAKGGIAGKSVEIVPIDDAADAPTGVTAANAAIKAGLDGVVGPYNSGVGIKTLPLYQKAGLVPVRLTSDSATNGMGITLQPMDYQIAPVASEALTKWQKAKSVAIIYDPTQNYTTSVSAALKKDLEKDGVKITAFEKIKPGGKDYSSTVKKVAATNPDVIYAATYFPEGGLIAKEMLSEKVKAQCIADYASADPGFVTTAGVKAAMKCPVVGVPGPEDFPDATSFNSDYQQKFSDAPGTWSPYTYDSVNILADAVTKAGGWDAAKLTSTLKAEKDWKGITGSVTIDPANGNRDPATVVLLDTSDKGTLSVDPTWAKAVGAPY